MKLLLVAGPPSVGKTTIVKRVIEQCKGKYKICYFKMDVVKAYEAEELKNEYGINTKISYSGDMCPDHAEVMVLEDVIEWGEQNDAGLLIIESAGLCLRCSPFLSHGIGVAVQSLTSGIYSVEKMQSLISLADVVMLTRIDLVSQVEREVFLQKIIESHSNLSVLETNALQGTGISRLCEMIDKSEDIDMNTIYLKGNPPIGTCTICVGKKEIGWKHHFGVVKKLSGDLANSLYRGD